MVYISFWIMMMMFMYWTAAYILWKKNAETLVVASKNTGL